MDFYAEIARYEDYLIPALAELEFTAITAEIIEYTNYLKEAGLNLENMPLMRRAIPVMTLAHFNQFRKTGNRKYAYHCLEVAVNVFLITRMRPDCDAITAAALLHDTNEIPEELRVIKSIIQLIECEFGSQIASWVKELTNSETRIRLYGKTSHSGRKLMEFSAITLLIKLEDFHASLKENPSDSYIKRIELHVRQLKQGIRYHKDGLSEVHLGQIRRIQRTLTEIYEAKKTQKKS